MRSRLESNDQMPVLLFLLWFGAGQGGADLEKARDTQDRASLERIAAQLSTAAGKQANDAAAQYQAALAQSYLAEVATEMRDKNQARAAAEAGTRLGQTAVGKNTRAVSLFLFPAAHDAIGEVVHHLCLVAGHLVVGRLQQLVLAVDQCLADGLLDFRIGQVALAGRLLGDD